MCNQFDILKTATLAFAIKKVKTIKNILDKKAFTSTAVLLLQFV